MRVAITARTEFTVDLEQLTTALPKEWAKAAEKASSPLDAAYEFLNELLDVCGSPDDFTLYDGVVEDWTDWDVDWSERELEREAPPLPDTPPTPDPKMRQETTLW